MFCMYSHKLFVILQRLSILRSVRTGRLARRLQLESGQFFRMDNEQNVHVIGIIIPYTGHIISFGVDACLLHTEAVQSQTA